MMSVKKNVFVLFVSEVNRKYIDNRAHITGNAPVVEHEMVYIMDASAERPGADEEKEAQKRAYTIFAKRAEANKGWFLNWRGIGVREDSSAIVRTNY